jgi:YVTN family beta-propeller protein
MTPRNGPGWASLATIVITALLGWGAVGGLSASDHGAPTPAPVGLAATETPASVHRTAGSGSPSASPYAVLNESTLVLSNNTLVPGDFFSTSADLPSLETYDPLTNEVFVESFYGGAIDVISGSSDRVVATISTGAYPNTLAWDPVGNNLYFGLQTYDEVSLVNASTDLIERTVGIGIEPLAMAADPVSGNLFVTGTNSTGTAFVAVLNGSSGVLQSTFSLGAARFPVAGPNGIVYDPEDGDFYIPSVPTGSPTATHGNLTIVNAARAAVIGNVSLSFEPSSILYVPTNGDLYLGNQSGDNLSVFEPAAQRTIGSVQLPNTPSMLAYDGGDHEIFVGIEGNVSVVSVTSGSVVKTFPVDRNPSGLAYDPLNGYVYVADYVWNNVSIVSATSYAVVGSALLGASPYNMAYDSANGDLYVADLLSSQLIVVNSTSNRVIGFVPLDTTPYGVAYDPQTKDLYVDDYYAGNVSIVNPAKGKIIGYLPAGTDAWGIAYDAADHDLYVTNPGSDNITVLDPTTRSVVTSLNFTTSPGAIAYDPHSKVLFVGEYNTENVSVLNAKTNALIRNSTTGSEPYTIAIDPGTGDAFVGNYASDNVTILGPKGAELNRSVTAGVGVFGSAYDPADGDVYVVSFSSDLVTVINSSSGTGVGGYEVGSGPVAVAADPGTGMVYVANYDSDSLSLLSPTFRVTDYNVTFEESGLPTGTPWSVRLDGVGRSGTGTNLTYAEPNGTLQAYSIGEVAGFNLTPEFGTATVNGGAIVISIVFAAPPPSYSVTFKESGLPTGTIWSVTLGSDTLFTNRTSLTFRAANGTYAYTVALVSGFHTKHSGSLTVSGAAVKRTLKFSVTNYTVEFTETGLPSGTRWCVTFNGSKSCLKSSSIDFVGVVNGTYSYIIGHVTGYNLTGSYRGQLMVTGAGPGTVSNTMRLTWTKAGPRDGLGVQGWLCSAASATGRPDVPG